MTRLVKLRCSRARIGRKYSARRSPASDGLNEKWAPRRRHFRARSHRTARIQIHSGETLRMKLFRFQASPAYVHIAGVLFSLQADAPRILARLMRSCYGFARLRLEQFAHRSTATDGAGENGRRNGDTAAHVRKCPHAAETDRGKLPKLPARLPAGPAPIRSVGALRAPSANAPHILTRLVKFSCWPTRARWRNFACQLAAPEGH